MAYFCNDCASLALVVGMQSPTCISCPAAMLCWRLAVAGVFWVLREGFLVGLPDLPRTLREKGIADKGGYPPPPDKTAFALYRKRHNFCLLFRKACVVWRAAPMQKYSEWFFEKVINRVSECARTRKSMPWTFPLVGPARRISILPRSSC